MIIGMARWEPGAHGRMMAAAIALFTEYGYENVTVAQIAAEVGVTERTFFRHFTEKREVLFDGAGGLQNRVVELIAAAPPGGDPWTVTVDAMREMCDEFFDGRREQSRQRQRIIESANELQERELLKLAALTSAITAAHVERGCPANTSELVARAGVAVFTVGFGRWIDGPVRQFSDAIADVAAELHGAIAHSTRP